MQRTMVLAAFMVGVTAMTPRVVYADEVEGMGTGADLTGTDGSETGEHVVPEVEAVSSPAPQPVEEPDLTVGSSRAQQFQLSGIWRLLAQCESSGNPRAVSAGGIYRGLYQFDQSTWVSVGGLAFASRADLASPGDQLVAAQRLQARRGWAPWPVCSRHLGLR